MPITEGISDKNGNESGNNSRQNGNYIWELTWNKSFENKRFLTIVPVSMENILNSAIIIRY